MVHEFVFQVNFPESDRCQILHGAASWCLMPSRTVKSSVGMLCRLFRIDFDVVVWQWEVNLSD